MKKLTRAFCLALSVVLSFSLFGCGAQELVLDLETTKPWETVTEYEKCEYKVEKYTLKKQGKEYVNDVLIAEGLFTSTIEMNARLDGQQQVSRLSTSLSVTYNNSDEAFDKTGAIDRDNRNLTDTMTSVVEFFTAGLNPLTAVKSFVIAPRPNETKEQNTSYNYSGDYKTGKATVTLQGKTKEVAIPAGAMDSEQMYMIARALKSTKPKSSGSFYITNILNCFISEGAGRDIMGVNTAEAVRSMEVAPGLNKFLKPGEDGKYKVDCLESDIGLASTTPGSGPKAKLFITKSDVKFASGESGSRTTNKILLQFYHTEYNIPQVQEYYRTFYTLNNYSTEKE